MRMVFGRQQDRLGTGTPIFSARGIVEKLLVGAPPERLLITAVPLAAAFLSKPGKARPGKCGR